MTNKNAFTLIEIIVAMSILGILAAIAIPNYFSFIEKGAAQAANNNLMTIYGAQKNYYFSNEKYCIAGCDTLADINLPANLSLNITDNYYNYACTNPNADNGITYTCTATRNNDAGAPQLSITSLPISSTAAPPNPQCQNNGPTYCP